jgi:hypothetical protein
MPTKALMMGALGVPLGGAVTYAQKILSYAPIAYWPLNEASGSAAICQVNAAQNGTYTGVTLGQPGIGDGGTCPLFDGVNDYVDLYSTTLRDAFNGAEGSISLWAKVSNVATWTSGAFNEILTWFIDNNNLIYLDLPTGNNELRIMYEAGNVPRTFSQSTSTTDWFHLVATWSAGADELSGYFNGIEVAASPVNGLGVWAGQLLVDRTLIGAYDKTAAFEFPGYIAHIAVWDSVISQAVVTDLATV